MKELIDPKKSKLLETERAISIQPKTRRKLFQLAEWSKGASMVLNDLGSDCA